jgi:hypothetical protein
MYREANRESWPKDVATRLSIYPVSGRCFLSDWDPPEADVNLFNLEANDITMLDKLLEFRTVDSTSTVVIDIDYNDLTTNLSKMIFLYLDLKINGNYERYNNEILISDEGLVLECCYEVYLVESMFNSRAIHTVF